ncbi:MFS transporter [Lentzea sp. NPDC003310]|uniref:MFS transporter n=1 Tax=Lentzea sp. NPDC003310 TaxID=3154447 RepID=UPI0033A933C2
MSPPVLRLTLAFDYLLSNFGRFSLMPVIAVLLASQSDGPDWIITGVGLFGHMLSSGLSSLLVTRWLPRFTYRATLPASMVFAAAGFGLLPYSGNPVVVLVLLFVAGFGISVHAVLARVLIAEMIESETGRNTIYSIQQIATNAAASLGPFIAAALYVSGDSRPLLAFVGGAYLLAAVALLVGLPRGQYPPEAVRERSEGFFARLKVLRDRQCREAMVLTATGAFAYAQFYSAFALLVAFAVDSAVLRGSLLAGPPIAIVLLQVFVTAASNRVLRAGWQPLAILTAAVLLFGVAMVLLGVGLPFLVGTVIAMAVFVVAEMLFTPTVSIAFNRISSVPRLVSSNLQGVAWTTGEAVGSLFGGSLFLLCWDRGAGNVYWLVLAALTVAGAAPFVRRAVVERTVS